MRPEQRQKAMRSNRGRTKPERALAALLWWRGLRYLTSEGYKHRHGTAIPGHPDLIFHKERTILFMDGCFWHGCPSCQRAPANTGAFWLEKIRRNVERDGKVTRRLRRSGWMVIRVWEHDLKTKQSLAAHADALARRITGRKGAAYHA
jgi:DNA mismatch endonuclease (patch repair protein)